MGADSAATPSPVARVPVASFAIASTLASRAPAWRRSASALQTALIAPAGRLNGICARLQSATAAQLLGSPGPCQGAPAIG